VKIRPLGDCFAAEVLDVQLSTVDDETFRRIEEAFYAYSVLVFHDQPMSEDEHVAFSRRFGELEPTMVNDPSGGGGPLNHIANVDENGRLIPMNDPRMIYNTGNSLWHTDSSYKPIPAKASLLFAEAVPPAGGETELACMRAAYETLSRNERERIEDLVVEHDLAYSRSRIDPNMMSESFRREVPPQRQALVRTLPETGRKTFYAGAHAARVIGWSDEESRDLIDELNDLATRTEFVYSHRWTVNDLLMWDNRCCLHRGRPWDGSRYARVMRRTTLAGDGPTLNTG
jgi:alpha-ketoglutarate-dependent 2,4-dichlorophenoxyacetate dioxygenase